MVVVFIGLCFLSLVSLGLGNDDWSLVSLGGD